LSDIQASEVRFKNQCNAHLNEIGEVSRLCERGTTNPHRFEQNNRYKRNLMPPFCGFREMQP